MILYHGTSVSALTEIEEEGVQAPSYWTNDFATAKQYADSFGAGVVLACDSRRYTFSANMLVAQCLFDNGDIDQMPSEDDLGYSLEHLEGVVCQEETIFDFEVVTHPVEPA